jgi:prepilin-type N-terminal cleavage/methylation domain-containing protein
MKPVADKTCSGFTLMELLIALSLFSAIAGILMSSFFQFNQQSNRMASMLKLRQETRILERIIRNDIQSVVYLYEFMNYQGKDTDGRKSGILGIDEMLGEKSGDKLHLHVNAPSRFQRTLKAENDPKIHEVSYFLEEAEDGRYLFKRREEFYVDTEITEGERSIIHTLSHHIISFDVKYYMGAEEEPLDEWDSSKNAGTKPPTSALPSGVIVSLEIRGEDGETLTTDLQVNLKPQMGTGVIWRKL